MSCGAVEVSRRVYIESFFSLGLEGNGGDLFFGQEKVNGGEFIFGAV